VLVIAVVTVITDLSLRKYLDPDNSQTSVISAVPKDVTDVTQLPKDSNLVPPAIASSAPIEVVVPLEPVIVTPPEPSILTKELILSSALGEDVSDKHFDGKVFQLLDITSTPVADVNSYEMSVEKIPVASITEITLADEIRAMQLYLLLQNKTKPFIDLSLNETNTYGARSFYINHAKKTDEAFLTVQIGKRLYNFAYLKIYHNEVKNLLASLQK